MAYRSLSETLKQHIEEDIASGKHGSFAFSDAQAVRRDVSRDKGTLLRPTFVRDSEKILHCPFYNRYADKTQVFSLYKNDDISRRALHVQLVSRIARNIGRVLGLNLDLIEAIALGHDIGHTPFGHAGEHFLCDEVREHTGGFFLHNVQSVRVLDGIFPYNVTLPVLNGILTHNGECELATYIPTPIDSFTKLDKMLIECKESVAKNNSFLPSTLEGCVVRISDLIAYIGKDRQDAERTSIGKENFSDGAIGVFNAEMINNLSVSVIENSYGKPYISLDDESFAALKEAKTQNYEKIYLSEAVSGKTREYIAPLFHRLYKKLLSDLKDGKKDSPIFTHHIALVEASRYTRALPYREENKCDIVADYIASMTDDYFIDLCAALFPDAPKIPYVSYFES